MYLSFWYWDIRVEIVVRTLVRMVMCAWMEVTCVVLQLSTLSFIIVVDWVTIVAQFVIKLPLCNV